LKKSGMSEGTRALAVDSAKTRPTDHESLVERAVANEGDTGDNHAPSFDAEVGELTLEKRVRMSLQAIVGSNSLIQQTDMFNNDWGQSNVAQQTEMFVAWMGSFNAEDGHYGVLAGWPHTERHNRSQQMASCVFGMVDYLIQAGAPFEAGQIAEMLDHAFVFSNFSASLKSMPWLTFTEGGTKFGDEYKRMKDQLSTGEFVKFRKAGMPGATFREMMLRDNCLKSEAETALDHWIEDLDKLEKEYPCLAPHLLTDRALKAKIEAMRSALDALIIARGTCLDPEVAVAQRVNWQRSMIKLVPGLGWSPCLMNQGTLVDSLVIVR
jgi:hypothetical protein